MYNPPDDFYKSILNGAGKIPPQLPAFTPKPKVASTFGPPGHQPLKKITLKPLFVTPSSGKIAAVASMTTDIAEMLKDPLPISSSRSVPKIADISLTGGKAIESAVLYIDIRGSTSITERHPDEIAAKIYKSFLYAMVRIARFQQRGHVRGFAGDRIMVVFDNTEVSAADRAVETAVWMQSMVEQVLSPRLAQYCQHPISCGVGIDYSKIIAVRGGTKGYNNNDTIWAGKAANIASKLSDLAKPGAILVSKRAKDRLTASETSKFRPDTWNKVLALTTSPIGSYFIVPPSVRYRLK
jgi:class 3 adenylate cyclase